MRQASRTADGVVTIRGGPASDAELAAAQTIGYIREYNVEVIPDFKERVPAGFSLVIGSWTHDYEPNPPAAIVDKDPILMGFCRVRSGDPHYPYWLYQK